MDRQGYIVLDFETTGLLEKDTEVLQVSAIDENDNVLISGYCRPEYKTSWEGAQAVHGISPEMVAGCPTFREVYLPKLKGLINQKAAVIAYNAEFERGVLQIYGVDVDVVFIDPMLMFARVYGDYNEYFGDYRWQKLSTAAYYYGYEFKAHDALEDVRATKYIFEKMIEAGEPAIMI